MIYCRCPWSGRSVQQVSMLWWLDAIPETDKPSCSVHYLAMNVSGVPLWFLIKHLLYETFVPITSNLNNIYTKTFICLRITVVCVCHELKAHLYTHSSVIPGQISGHNLETMILRCLKNRNEFWINILFMNLWWACIAPNDIKQRGRFVLFI